MELKENEIGIEIRRMDGRDMVVIGSGNEETMMAANGVHLNPMRGRPPQYACISAYDVPEGIVLLGEGDKNEGRMSDNGNQQWRLRTETMAYNGIGTMYARIRNELRARVKAIMSGKIPPRPEEISVVIPKGESFAFPVPQHMVEVFTRVCREYAAEIGARAMAAVEERAAVT